MNCVLLAVLWWNIKFFTRTLRMFCLTTFRCHYASETFEFWKSAQMLSIKLYVKYVIYSLIHSTISRFLCKTSLVEWLQIARKCTVGLISNNAIMSYRVIFDLLLIHYWLIVVILIRPHKAKRSPCMMKYTETLRLRWNISKYISMHFNILYDHLNIPPQW